MTHNLHSVEQFIIILLFLYQAIYHIMLLKYADKSNILLEGMATASSKYN